MRLVGLRGNTRTDILDPLYSYTDPRLVVDRASFTVLRAVLTRRASRSSHGVSRRRPRPRGLAWSLARGLLHLLPASLLTGPDAYLIGLCALLRLAGRFRTLTWLVRVARGLIADSPPSAYDASAPVEVVRAAAAAAAATATAACRASALRATSTAAVRRQDGDELRHLGQAEGDSTRHLSPGFRLLLL